MHGKQAGNKGFTKTQKVFVPKRQNHEQARNPTTTPKGPDSTPTLSNSLRQSSLSKQSDAGASASRVRKGENGDWVSSRAPSGSFVNYLPQDEAVAAGLGADEGGLDPVESQRVVDLLNRELSRLLKLKPREFWRQVASDSSLHEFLDSFLKFRSRWYDFPHHGAKGTVAGVIVGEFELSRRVFMVLYRISSSRDPGTRPADSLSPKDHEVLLQEKKLLDLPKLLDICAIYGHENEDLTRILVGNAFKAQPRMHNDLTSVMSHLLNIIHTMHQRCSSSLEVLSSSASHGDHESSHLCADMLEVMDFMNDAIISMDALVSVYKPATLFFSSPVEISYGNEELLGTLVKLHDSLLPSLKRGFQMILTSGEDGMASNIGVSLKMLSMRISIFGWKLLEFCYLTDEVSKDNLPIPAAAKMFPANVEDPVIRADILVQTFREISEVSLHKEENQNWETFLQKVEKNFNIMRKIGNLRNTGWIFMDDEQLEYLSVIFTGSKKITTNEARNAAIPVTNNKVKMDEDAAIMESKISQIKDLFPDYGRGFLLACLEAYNQNPEEVIQRILEGVLHEDLQSLDTSLETMPVPKTAMTISKNDKGKAKLIEPETLPATNLVPTRSMQPNEGPSISSSSSVGRFVRKSKADTNSDSLDIRDEKDLAVNVALMSQYEYEDEYDDSFDDLGLSVAESGFEENEILSDKMSSNNGKPWEKESDTSQIPPSSKWGSRKRPQYYVKDGKNYSYKVEGAVAVANAGEASIVIQAQQELIYGLGRGGNLPLGAVKKLTEASEQQDKQPDISETLVRGFGNPRGRARRGGGRHREPLSVEQDKQSGVSEVEGSENLGNHGVKGRRGGGRGRNNHYRKDRSMNKHFSGLSG